MEFRVENLGLELDSVCRRHRVSRLLLFGSAVDGGFDPLSNDLDFAVEFAEMSPVEHKRAYFGLLRDLGSLFEREVDLVEPCAISNPYLLRSIEKHQRVVYAAA